MVTKWKHVEFSEGTYAALWLAVTKTGDADTLSLFKEVVHMVESPVLHYTVETNLLYGFVDDIRKYKVDCDINMIFHNCHNKGYFRKHYSHVIPA